MRLTVTASDLKAALDVATPFTAKRSVLPVLAHVLCDATPDGGLVVSGTDTERRAARTVPAIVEEAGSVTLPPDQASGLLALLAPTEIVSLTVNAQHKATLACGKTSVRVAGLDPEQFPPGIDFSTPQFDLTLSASAFCALMDGTLHAAAKLDNRAWATGIELRLAGGTLTATTADGYRLARRSVPVDGDAELSQVVLAAPLGLVARRLPPDGTVRLAIDARRSTLLVESTSNSWQIRLIEAQFPDTERIVPREYAAVVRVDRDRLLSAVRLAADVDGTHLTRLSIYADSVLVHAKGDDDRGAEDDVPSDLVSGEPMGVAFNGRYLRDAIEVLPSGAAVLLEIVGPESPARVRIEGDEAWFQIVMPMHVAR